MFGVAPRELFAFAVLVELFEGIGARRFQQAVARDPGVELRGDQRLRDQAGKARRRSTQARLRA